MLTDEELAQRGDFDGLYDRYRAPIYQFLVRQTGDEARAEDLVQATFLKAFASLRSFRGRSSFKTWLFTIAVNCVRDDRRSLARAPAEVELNESFVASPGQPTTHELSRTLRGALDQLAPQHRMLFLLTRYHELTLAQAGEMLGLTHGSARVTILRIQKRLCELLGKVPV